MDDGWILDSSLVGSKPGVVPSLCFFRRVRLAAHSTFTSTLQRKATVAAARVGGPPTPLRKNNAAVRCAGPGHSFKSTRRSRGRYL